MHVSELAIHPLKSARRLPVQELRLGPLGPQWDRRWMLVDGDGCLIGHMNGPAEWSSSDAKRLIEAAQAS